MEESSAKKDIALRFLHKRKPCTVLQLQIKLSRNWILKLQLHFGIVGWSIAEKLCNDYNCMYSSPFIYYEDSILKINNRNLKRKINTLQILVKVKMW